jgi:hypothetical protein
LPSAGEDAAVMAELAGVFLRWSLGVRLSTGGRDSCLLGHQRVTSRFDAQLHEEQESVVDDEFLHGRDHRVVALVLAEIA